MMSPSGRYVIMPDHIHLFVAFPATGITLSKWIKSLRSVLGKELLRVGVQKPHWQEGFFDHLLRSSESYSEKWEYVRMNPVRARLCAEPEDWPYQGELVRMSTSGACLRRLSAVATTSAASRYCCGAGSFFGWRLSSVICLIRAESDGLQVATSGSSLKALWTSRRSYEFIGSS
jgi:hypothetical protein